MESAGIPGSSNPSALDRLYRSFPDFSAWDRLGSIRRDLWQRFAADLDGRRQASSGHHLAKALSVAVRAAALDTGALEGLYQVDRGFTMTVATQAFAWEAALGERDPQVRALFEAHLAGYELAIDAVTQQTPMSEAWLRVLHDRLCAPQSTYRVLTELGWQEQPLPKGRYKEQPNHVRLADGSVHAYAPVALVAPEMQRLFEQLRGEDFDRAHPVEQAAYAHHALTVIHPFADGNGRVARALASVYLYRSLSIPLVIFAQERSDYLDALAQADRGEQAAWLDFIADRGIDTMQLILESLRSAAVPQPDEVAERLAGLYRPRGRTHGELDSLALRLLAEAEASWREALGRLSLPDVKAETSKMRNAEPPPAGYRRVGGSEGPVVRVALQAPAPWSGTVALVLRVVVALGSSELFGLRLQTLSGHDHLDIRESDVSPTLSESLKLRLAQWVQRHLAVLLTQLEAQSQQFYKTYR